MTKNKLFLLIVAIFIAGLFIVYFAFYHSSFNADQLVQEYDNGAYKKIEIIYPFDSSMFPPEISRAVFRWQDKNEDVSEWIIHFAFNDGEESMTFLSDSQSWKPELESWNMIKERSTGSYARVTILGVREADAYQLISGNSIYLTTSVDSVAAPIFYRDVPLPFAFARAHVDSIKWRLCNIASEETAVAVIENLPVCANCHSFSKNGKFIAMDVDALGIKSAYVTTELKEQTLFSPENFNYWSDFQEGRFTYGLLSQISPEGKYAVSTLNDHEIFVAKPDLEYSNFFFPIKGILVSYDRNTAEYKALKGADDTMFIQSNPSWSPDGQYIYFTKAVAIHTEESGITRGTAVADSNKFNHFLDSYMAGRRGLQFDIYRIPFNDGEGGEAIPLPGASNNGMSNYFPKISPDGKWIVFTKAKNFMLLQPDSKLYIMPAEGGEPREMRCNTSNMNSWHSWSPNGKWMVFASKEFGPFTQLFLTHIDENGNSTPPVLLENSLPEKRAANIPEFVNISPDMALDIVDSFSEEGAYNLFIRAFWLYNRGDINEAEQTLDFAIKKNPDDAQSYAFRGKIRYKKKKYEAALTDLNKAVELGNTKIDVLTDQSNVLFYTGDYNGAIEVCNRILAKEPDNENALFNRGASFQKKEKFNEALQDYNQAIALAPDYYQAYYNRGVIYYQQGKYLAAEEDFTKVIKMDPGESYVYVDRGNVRDLLGDLEGAMNDYDSAILIKPGFSAAYFHRASAKYNHGDTDGAIEDFSKTVEISPKYAEAWFRLGILYREQGRKESACECFQKASGLGFKAAKEQIELYCNP